MVSDIDAEATYEALSQIAKDDSDLSRPLEMDFFVAVPDEASGEVVASGAQRLGFRTSVEKDSGSGEWTCYCTTVLVPTLARVVALERKLEALAAPVGGRSDGFGTFGNGGPSSEGG